MDIYNKSIYPVAINSGLSVVDIIALASIIEAEARLVEEMPIISSVYHNRINKRMRLEADPTVLYYMDNNDLQIFKKFVGKKKSSKIFKKYKKIDNPYNTYLNYGLPIGPINNPSLNALESAIQPIKSNYFYFVADGTGGHIFTSSLSEHRKAIKKVKHGH